MRDPYKLMNRTPPVEVKREEVPESFWESLPFEIPRFTPTPYSHPPRLVIVSGAPGVGKTWRLVSDFKGRISHGKWAVISKTNFAVDNVNSQIPEAKAETIYKLVWNAFLKKAVKRGEIQLTLAPSKRGRKEYFHQAIHPGDSQLRRDYVMDAGSRAPKCDKEAANILSQWDPFTEPEPELLQDLSSLPSSCGFLVSLYLFCKWADHQWGAKVDNTDEPYGVILVDEAQDFLPLEAAALGWVALFWGCRIDCYGDPLQSMDQDRQLPKLWELADQVENYYGVPEFRRVPLEIAKLAELILPGHVPPAEEWANCATKGVIIPQSCARSAKLLCSRGFNLSESRDSVNRCAEHVVGTHYY